MSDQTPPDGGKEGSGFTAPQTQEELDRIIEARLARERAKFVDFDKYKADAEKLASIEEANKSEIDKLRERAEKSEAENKAFKAAQKVAEWKQEVATATGIPAAALSGSTKEELEAHAEVLKGIINPAGNPPAAPSVPGLGANQAGGGTLTTAELFEDAMDGIL
jgi:hypothetical protein